ncbi:MAG: NAD-dependent epimerase/dehydratase family protein, partial [Akkermansiaceae bacterium]|nr:NAD-dependent epimerase/dehydratase family protein [Akkermansiaceae bacterium]
DVVITRGTCLYGPRQHPAEFIPTVVRQAVGDEPVPLAREGMQVRDWLHVDDYCRGMIAAFLRGAPGEIFNFGGQCERTDLGVARNVVELLGKPASLITGIPAKSRENGRCAVECTKALRYFGWRPELAIKNALGNLARELASNVVAQQ